VQWNCTTWPSCCQKNAVYGLSKRNGV